MKIATILFLAAATVLTVSAHGSPRARQLRVAKVADKPLQVTWRKHDGKIVTMLATTGEDAKWTAARANLKVTEEKNEVKPVKAMPKNVRGEEEEEGDEDEDDEDEDEEDDHDDKEEEEVEDKPVKEEDRDEDGEDEDDDEEEEGHPTVVKKPSVKNVTPVKPAKVAVPKTQVKPVKATPVKVLPVKATPVKATPVKVLPVKATPVKATPVKVLPIGATPVKATPVKLLPVKVLPVKATPVKVTPVKATAVKPNQPQAKASYVVAHPLINKQAATNALKPVAKKEPMLPNSA